MRFWPLNRHLKATLKALRIDDRPLRVEYARRAHCTVAMMRDRLAEPGDHLQLVWPRFESYSDFVFATARHSRRSDCVRLWKSKGDVVRRAFRFAALSDFDVVTTEVGGRITAVEFRPKVEASDPERTPTSYLVELS